MRALGVVLTMESKLQEARPLLERALSLSKESAHGELHEGIAIALGSLAMNDYYSGYYPAAEERYTRSLAILRTIYGNDHQFNIAVVLFQLAETAGKRNDYPRAEGLVREALPIFIEAQGSDGPKPAMAHIQLGHVLFCERKYSAAKQESQWGYNLLMKQPHPESQFFEMSKKDLIEEDKHLSAGRIATR